MPRLVIHNLLLLLACLFGVAAPVMADDEVLDLIGSPEKAAETVVTTSRAPRPASKIAENVSVITASDIARLNAHTLADLLQTVPGIEVEQMQTPGSFAFFAIHNNISRHIQVLIDGVPQNFLGSDNSAEIGLIPVQMIERVEIVKGAAATSWGQSLGGVINVITKSPDPERTIGGTASASYGQRATSDLRGEISGTSERIGYYLTGGNIHSNGLLPGNRINFNHAFGKLTYDLPTKGRFTLGLDFRDAFHGLEDVPGVPYPDDYHDYGGSRFLNSALAFSYPLADRLLFEAKTRIGRQEIWTTQGNLSTTELYTDVTARQDSRSAAVNLTWGDRRRFLTTGMEYEHNRFANREPLLQNEADNFDRSMDRLSGYLNGSWTFGQLTIIPGLRYDHTNNFGGALSYNLGATWQLTDTTVLRSYFGNGYGQPVVGNIPVSNGTKQLQKIWTVQAGIESSALPYLWLKGSYFYSETSRIEQFVFPEDSNFATIDLRQQTRQGFELEGRTSPLYDFSLSCGYTFTEARDKDTGKLLKTDSGQNNPTHLLKLGLSYDNADVGLKGILTGNYVDWNMPEGSDARYGSVIWDLHLNQKLFPHKELSPEIFFSLRNLFDADQYQRSIRPNAPRWIEGGVRFKF